jgi:hypothetical protein
MPRNRHKRPCTYPGCNAWARRDSEAALCAPHAHLAAKEAAREPINQPPRSHGGQPGNQNRLVHGFYRRTLQLEDIVDLDDGAGATDLGAEVLIARVALRRTLAMLCTGTDLGEEPRPLVLEETLRIIALAFQGVRTVARLIAAKRDLDPEDVSAIAQAIGEALDQLSEEWGIEL